MQNGWVEEFWRLVFVLLVAAILGVMFGYLPWLLTAGLLLYTARNLYNLNRLTKWLSEPSEADIPIHFGIWGEIYAKTTRMIAHNRQREKRLSNLLVQFQHSLSALPDAVVALGTNREILWFNDAASELLGLRPSQDNGQILTNLYRNPQLTDYLASDIQDKPLIIPAPGNAGSRQLSIRLAPYSEDRILLLAQDVTERLRVEAIRRDFVANVSHELRTPLTVIGGFVENMQNDESECRQRWDRALHLIEQQSDRMKQIVEDLLLLARVETASVDMQNEPINLADLCEMLAEDARALRDGGPNIEVHVPDGIALRGDRKQLQSAFGNLIVNAVNHTPADGSISVKWHTRDGMHCLSVIDTGEGIAAEHIPRLTERFYRVDAGRSRERGGTGLGLAIVKHILQRHDAHLSINSTQGKGSEFSCCFPETRVIRT